VIATFRHKGLQRCYETGKVTGIQPSHAKRPRLQLAALETAQTVEDMDVPGFRLHALRGRLERRWSIWVNSSWRLTFEFEEGNVHLLDYEDSH